jgi:hypothetical protein
MTIQNAAKSTTGSYLNDINTVSKIRHSLRSLLREQIDYDCYWEIFRGVGFDLYSDYSVNIKGAFSIKSVNNIED